MAKKSLSNIDYVRDFRETLDSVSPSFCMAKWLQVTIHLGTGQTHSCHHPTTHNIPVEELKDNPSALHNTKFKKKQRQKMLDGERPSECQYCWNVEDMGSDHFSDRSYKSAALGWAGESRFDSVLNVGADANINPTYLELSFSNNCNLACTYCSSEASSNWKKEIDQFGPYGTSEKHGDISWYKDVGKKIYDPREENPYVDAFWRWWPDLIKDLKILRLTGGEPLMEKNVFKMLDYLANTEDELSLTEFSINTNGMVGGKKLDRFIEYMTKINARDDIQTTILYTSMEAHGAQGTYVRHGGDYDTWHNNIDYILTALPDTQLTMMMTMNILSLASFKDVIVDIQALRIKHKDGSVKRKNPIIVSTPILRYPHFLSASLASSDMLDGIRDTVNYMKENAQANNVHPGFTDVEIDVLGRFLHFAEQGPVELKAEGKHIPTLKADFYKFIVEHDTRRNTDFLATFPQLTNFWNECKQHKENRII